MRLPSAQTLYDVIDATWPAAEKQQAGPFTLRCGLGGGSRVSAATATAPASIDDIQSASDAMRNMGQPALFMVRGSEDALDAQLAGLGFEVMDPVTLYAAPIDVVATERPPHMAVFTAWPPLAVQAEIWAQGGVGPARLAVMERTPDPKIAFLGRARDQPAGAVFVGIAHECAMIHALEIGDTYRRQGLGLHMTRAAAFWGRDNGARFLTLVTTNANTGANALYTSLGMQVVGHYHYRIKKE